MPLNSPDAVALKTDTLLDGTDEAEAEERSALEDQWCPHFNLLLTVEVLCVCASITLGTFSMMEHAQRKTLDVVGWAWFTLGYFVLMCLVRPIVWARSLTGTMDALYTQGITFTKMRLVRQVAAALTWDVLLSLVSFSCIFAFYIQRSNAQLTDFDTYRYATELSIDVRLPVAWGNCMNFVTFAMMSNISTFVNLFFLQVVLSHRSREGLKQI